MTQVADKIDEAWRQPAEAARECIQLLGYPVIMLRCMPGEDLAGNCPGNVAEHALSYFTVLRAIADHQLLHLSAGDGDNRLLTEFHRIYEQAVSDLACPH